MTIVDLFTIKTLLWGLTGILMAGAGIALDDTFLIKDAIKNLYLGFVWAIVVYGVVVLLALDDYHNVALVVLLVGAMKPKAAFEFVYKQVIKKAIQKFNKGI